MKLSKLIYITGVGDEYSIQEDVAHISEDVALAYVVADNLARLGNSNFNKLGLVRHKLWNRVKHLLAKDKTILDVNITSSKELEELFSFYNSCLKKPKATKIFISKIPTSISHEEIKAAILTCTGENDAILNYNDANQEYALASIKEATAKKLINAGQIEVKGSCIRIQLGRNQEITHTSTQEPEAAELRGALALRYLLNKGYKIEDKYKPLIKFVIPKGAEKQTTDLQELMKMNPADVEVWAAKMLSYYGWDTLVTLDSKDMGVDVVAFKNNRRRTVQVKRRKDSEGAGELFKTLGGSWLWGSTEILFICTGGLIEKAAGYANASPVPLFRVENEIGIKLKDSWL